VRAVFEASLDAIFLIDDASPYTPEDADVMTFDALPERLPDGPRAFRYRFATHEGRQGLYGHRGWWRSFLYSLTIARTLGFGRIVHIEADAFLLTRRIVDRFNELENGWTAFYFPAYGVAEPALQVIGEDQFDAMATFTSRTLDDLTQDLAENMLPFTHIERNYSGNRYGEMRGRIPGYADYACQVNPSLPTNYRG